MVTMATGVASAGLSRCFNRARWWMTPLLYHSMLCHLQLKTTPARSPPHLRMLLCCLHCRKCGYDKKKQINKKASPVEMLPYDKRRTWLDWAPLMWGKCCWLQWQRGWHPVGDVSRQSNWAKRRSGSCFFIWPNCWCRMVVRKVVNNKQGMAQIEVLPHRQPACYLRHIIQAWKDPPSLLSKRPLKMDKQQGGR